MNPYKLDYPYKRDSKLSRRDWIVDGETYGLGGADLVHHSFAVTAPDYIQAEILVRRALAAYASGLGPDACYRLTMVREVVPTDVPGEPYWRSAVTLRVPDEWSFRLND